MVLLLSVLNLKWISCITTVVSITQLKLTNGLKKTNKSLAGRRSITPFSVMVGVKMKNMVNIGYSRILGVLNGVSSVTSR